MSLAAAASVLVALLGCGLLFFSASGQVEELEVQVEAAVRDSLQLADVIAQSGLLQSRADSIAERVEVLQEIDQGRYVWAHLMDEVARAVPEYLWLTRLYQITAADLPVFQIEGRAGTYFALTSLMEALEASPFIGRVQLVASEQVALATEGSAGERLLYEFILEASAENPPPELVETVPLFGPSVPALDVQGG